MQATRDDVEFALLEASELEPRMADEMVSLLLRSFDRWPPFDPGVPLVDHLRWKLQSPGARWAAVLGRSRTGEAVCAGASGAKRFAVTKGDGRTGSDGGERELIASLGIVTQRIWVQGRVVPRLRFIDQAVDPRWRGRGLSSAMNEFVQSSIELERLRLTDRSSHPAMHRLRERQGARPFGNPVRTMLCPLRPGVLARSAIVEGGRRRVAAAVLPVLAVEARRRRSRRSTATTARVRVAERFDERAGRLWERAAPTFDVAVVRDLAHLEWRYADPRGGRSVLLVAEEGSDLVGWAALKLGPRAQVADLLVEPGRDDVVEALARDALDRLEREGANEVACWLPGRHPYRAALRRSGFASYGAAIAMAYRWEGKGVVDDGLLARQDTRLHFTIGDSDFV